MKVIESKEGQEFGMKKHDVYFDTYEWVCIWIDSEEWEYQEDDNPDTYLSGGYEREGKTIVDYDGCFELPEAVKKAFRHLGYKLDRYI